MDISRFLAALVARMARKGEVKLLGLCIMCAYVSVMCLCVVQAIHPHWDPPLLLCILFSEIHALTAPDSDRLAGQQAPGVLLSLLQCWDCRHVLLVQSMGL